MSNFTDAFGRAIVFTTDAATDTYTIEGLSIGFPAGTPIAAVEAAFAGMAPASWTPPPPPPPATIDAFDFMQRFTPAERQAIQTAALSNWQIQFWLTQLAAALVVEVTAPKLASGIAELVSAGLLAPDRAARIVDLAAVSP